MFLHYRALERDFKGKLMAIKSDVKMEQELLMQQMHHQRTKLEADFRYLQEEDSSLRKKLTLMIKVRASAVVLCSEQLSHSTKIEDS